MKAKLHAAVVSLTAVMLFSIGYAQQAGNALQQQLAAVKQAAAANLQALHHYTWVETTQISLKGEVKSVKQSSCVYGPDGKVQKTPMAAPMPPQSPSGGRLKQR